MAAYATVTHQPGSGRITFSNNKEAFLELSNDVGSDFLHLSIPGEKEQSKFDELIEDLKDYHMTPTMENHVVAVPKNQLLQLSEYFEDTSFLSGKGDQRVSCLPRSYKINGETLSPYDKLYDYAHATSENLTQTAGDFVATVNRIKELNGEAPGYAAELAGDSSDRCR